MLYLLLSILFSVGITLALRFSEGKTNSPNTVLAVNYGVCMLCGAFFLKRGDFASEGMTTVWIIGIVTGVLFLLSLKMTQKNLAVNGVILSTIFNKLSVVIPTLTAILVFGERPDVFQIVGLVLVTAAILVFNLRPGGKGDSENTGKSMFLLLLLLLCSGMSSTANDVFSQICGDSHKNLYLVLVFATACLLSVILAFISGKKPFPMDFLFGALVGIPNYFSSRFLLYALNELPGVVVFPVFCVGGIALSTLAGALVFKEKLQTREIIGLMVALAAVVLMNL